MRFAIDIPNFGDFADPRIVADAWILLTGAVQGTWAACRSG